MGRHHRDEEVEAVRSQEPCGKGGILGGLFGGDSNTLLIILIAVLFLCFCNKGGTTSLGDTPVKLAELFLKSKTPTTPA